MDPLSMTLAVVSLASAVKDLVELGQKINESFARVSNNFRNAQRVAEDITEMVEEIRVFCEDNKDALDNMKDFRLALQGLLAKFRSFETSILSLLPQTGGRRRDRIIRSWDAWRNNNKIEASILDLQSDIMKVIRRHMMKSTMRTELKLNTIHQETSRDLTGITHNLEIVRRDVFALRLTAEATTMAHCSYESSGTTNDEINRNIIMFAQSSSSFSAPMLRTPYVITEELMTTAYIKLQVNTIATTVEKMLMLPASALNTVIPFQMFPAPQQMSMSITDLQHDVVRQVIDIREVLDTKRIHTFSMHQGAIALHALLSGLETLGMHDESMLVSKWAITLVRSLINASGGRQRQPDLAATLALNLLRQSVRYCINGNKIQSLEAVEEARRITQNLRNHYSGQVNFEILYSKVLLQYSELVDNQQSVEMYVEAVQVLEGFLNVQAYNQPNLSEHIQNDVPQHNSSFVDDLFSSAPPAAAITGYAFALHKLGASLLIEDQPEIALDLQLLAISIRRKMVAIHGNEHKIDVARAILLLILSRPQAVIPIPTGELIDMADECIELFRELAAKNPLRYARDLTSALYAKAVTLDTLDRDAEAIATWEEVANLAGETVEDSELCSTVLAHLSNKFRRIKRHDDAVRAGTLAIKKYHGEANTRAERYFNLSLDLQKLRRYKESSDAAQTSVELYRHLAIRDSATWMNHLTEALSNLSHCLAASGNYSEAMSAWDESVSMLDNFLNSNPDARTSSDIKLIGTYLAAIRLHRILSYVLKGEEECLIVGLTAVQHLHQMSELYPQNADTITMHLMWAEFRYTYNLLRVGSLQDGQQYIDHWFDVWNKKLEAAPESNTESLRWYTVMTNLKANMLDGQGSTKQALLAIQKVLDIAMMLPVTLYQPGFEEMIELMIEEARLRVNLGDSDRALRVAERALQLSREATNLKPMAATLGWSLHRVAATAFSCGRYQHAIEAAREGCIISGSPNWQNDHFIDEDDIHMRPSLFAILSSAEANLGRYSTALEYALRAVEESLEIREMKSSVSATAAEQSYMETRGNKAEILLVTGDVAQARQICEERRAYFSKRVEKRAGEYRDLAPILRMLGILCCSEGRHEEGDAAAKELSRIMKTLGSVYPNLQDQVKIRLGNQAKVPILKVLNNMNEKLDCKHQTEVTSLFAT